MPVRHYLANDRRRVCPADMEDGEIGKIVSHEHQSYVGLIVQRNGIRLISLGLPDGKSFSGYSEDPKFVVQILEPGDLIEITK